MPRLRVLILLAVLAGVVLTLGVWTWPGVHTATDDDFARALTAADRETLYGDVTRSGDVQNALRRASQARAEAMEEVRKMKAQVADMRQALAAKADSQRTLGQQAELEELQRQNDRLRAEARQADSRVRSGIERVSAGLVVATPEPGPDRAQRLSEALTRARQDLREYAGSVARRIRDVVHDSDAANKLAETFEGTFMNTVDKTMWVLPSRGSLLVVTGDIIDMWLRDSAAQVEHYVRCCSAKSKAVTDIAVALLHEHAFMALQDPYANAFRGPPRPGDKVSPAGLKGAWGPPFKGVWWDREHKLRRGGFTATANYELDSFAYTMRLAHLLWRTSGTVEMFDPMFRAACLAMLVVWRREQKHAAQSLYRYPELTQKGGLENSPTSFTGMTWQAFRPSDDPCKYHYNVPGNMMASVALQQMAEIFTEVYKDAEAAADAMALKKDIDTGIERHAVVQSDGESVYAFEVDGLGNSLLADDANVPSLLSIPYLGWKADPAVLENTRRFILSSRNPWFYKGKYGAGIGSPHTPKGRFWPMALIMQGWTSDNPAEKADMLRTLLTTDAGKSLMHESVDANNPRRFSRDFFAWANSLFGGWVADMVETQTLPADITVQPVKREAAASASSFFAAAARLRGTPSTPAPRQDVEAV